MTSTQAGADPPTRPLTSPSPRALSQSTQTMDEEIAIIGMGCRTPGADNIRELWRVLKNGENHVTDVPEDRWNAKAFLNPNRSNPGPGKSYVQKGGFLRNLFGFDNGLYGINDYEASQMDPQQALILECTSMALEDAGIPYSQLSGSKTGVYIGCMNSDFLSSYAGVNSAVDGFTVTGTCPSVLAGRVAYVFNLQGPAMVIDTACSSSLLAIHQARLAIQSGDCDLALCGGVNCMLSPEMFCQLSKAQMMSFTGQCHAFSAEADGYTRSEGCGVILLKRLQDALRDGDKIWATVCTGTNQDGHIVSPMSAPSGDQQKKLLHAVYDKFQVDVGQMDYIEAHGTGTPVGDPVEVNALGSTFKERGESRDRYIGSLKTNIGHTESAAGVLGVMKVCLMMEHNLIVPSLHCHEVNPKIDLSDLRFIIPRAPIPWPRQDKMAGCSCYGFSGTNCHAVLKSVRKTRGAAQEQRPSSHVVCFSGRTLSSLKGSVADFVADEDALQKFRLKDVSYTSTARRQHRPYRVAFLARDTQDLLAIARQQLSSDVWSPPTPKQPDVVLVFCGMSTEWDGMCRQLLTENRVFRDAVTEVDERLRTHVSWSLAERLMQENVSSDLLLSPIAIFASQVGLAAVWRSLGIKPACVAGQSVGEVAAAYIAGCLSLADAVRIIYHRSQLLAAVSGGSMLFVGGVQVARVRQVLEKRFAGDAATVASEYSDTSCTISASSDVMPVIKDFLQSTLDGDIETWRMKDLDVSVAYHSPHVSRCGDALASLLRDVRCHPPTVPMLSSVTGTLVKTAPDAEYWADNVRKPVLFKQAITGAFSQCGSSNTVFLEIGPRPVLQVHLKNILPDQPVRAVYSMKKESPPRETDMLNRALVVLFESGVDINWKAVPVDNAEIADVPRYAFDRKQNRKYLELHQMLSGGVNVYEKNHLFTSPVRDQPSTYQVMISPLVMPTIYQHKIGGKILVPGAFMAEASLAVGRYLQLGSIAVGLEFQQVVTLHDDQVTHLTGEFQSPPESVQNPLPPLFFRDGEKPVASAHLIRSRHATSERKNVDHLRAKCRQKVTKDEIYATLAEAKLDYGPAYSLLQDASVAPGECLATLTVTEDVQREIASTIIHPSILDCAFQTTMFANRDDSRSVETRIPKSIGRLLVHRAMESTLYVHTRAKKHDTKKSVFDIEVLSSTGLVIAEITDFVLVPLETLAEEILVTHVWRKVSGKETLSLEGAHDAEAGSVLFVSNKKNFKYSSNDIVFEGSSGRQNVSEMLDIVLSGQHTLSAVVLVSATDLNDETDSDSIHSHLVAACCVVRDILQALKLATGNIAFYLCTFNAWTAVAEEVVSLCPAATALWGLLRTVNLEQVYGHVTAVELHLPSNFSMAALPSVFSRLVKSGSLRNYPEILITEDGVYANLVVKDKSTQIAIDRHRSHLDNEVNATTDNRTSEMSDTTAESQLNAGTDRNKTRIRINAVTTSPTEREPSSALVAPEFRGWELKRETEVASCYPVAETAEVSVPSRSVLPTSLIPGYQLGDVRKLIVLWELLRLVQSPEVTILASDATFHLAKLLELMRTEVIHESRVTRIVSLEALGTCDEFSDTVISLLLLDTALLAAIGPKMRKSQHLITVSHLAQPTALSLLARLVPEVEVTELIYQLLFQPKQLAKTIPEIRRWIRSNQSNISEIVEALHKDTVNASSSDLNCLLQSGHEKEAQTTGPGFKKKAAYIVVGGLTGLGWTCVQFLARENVGLIAILNRRPPTDEKDRAMKELMDQYDCQIRAFEVDVTMKEDLELVLNKISSRAEIRGVFMGAAVTKDMPFLSTTREAFHEVLVPKVRGAWNLHQLLLNEKLDFFVLHSSLASLLGNLGQASYSAANAFLDGLAMYRRQQGLAAQTVNWGPLDMGLLENKDDIKRMLESKGYLIASSHEVLDTLNFVLSLKPAQCVPARIKVKLFARAMLASRSKPSLRFREFASFSNNATSTTRPANTNDLSVAKLKTLAPEARARIYQDFLLKLVSEMTMLDPAQVPLDRTIFDLGMDSVSVTMMLDFIQRNTTFRISAAEVFAGDTTIASLAWRLSGLVDDSA